jgi:hypothetical protein
MVGCPREVETIGQIGPTELPEVQSTLLSAFPVNLGWKWRNVAGRTADPLLMECDILFLERV